MFKKKYEMAQALEAETLKTATVRLWDNRVVQFMRSTAEIQAVPIGAGVSVRQEVQRAYDLILNSGMTYELHASGTNVEGELFDILQLIEHIHKVLHKEGTVRLITFIKLETRTDKTPTLAGKRL
jgi:uncharacterized protein (TIGR00106 family)